MAFDGHRSAFASSLFPTYQRQASANVGGGNNGSMALPSSIPSISLQEQGTGSYLPWSNNAHDDPYGLISFVQSSSKSRKTTDNTDCEGETDLQGLVSNILDEVDSQDSYYCEGSLPTCNPVWSPKTLREELLQYFQSEAKTQYNSVFPPNYVSREALSNSQEELVDQDPQDFCQHPNGPVTNQQWLFSLSSKDRDSYSLRPQKGPNMGNAYTYQIQPSKYDNMSADKDRGSCQSFNHFHDLADSFRPQGEMSSACFNPYYEDHNIQSSTKPIINEQYGPQDINQLVSSFQSFMAGEHDNLRPGDLTSGHRQTVGIHQEDSMVEQWKITSPARSTQSTPAVQTQKQLTGEFGAEQMERNGRVRNQIFKHDAFQDLPGFSQNTEYSQQPKPFSGSFSLPNQYQNKISMQRENTSHSNYISMNQYPKHHIQQGSDSVKPQMQKEKKHMHMSGFLGEGFPTRPLTGSNTRGGNKKQALSQNLYFDHFGSMQSRRFNGENNMVSAVNTQQLMYPVNDLSRHTSMSINSSNFSSRSTLPHGNVAPGIDMCDMMSASESTNFNPYVSDMMTCRGESTYHGMASAMATSMMMNQGGPVIQLYFYLDECYEQWRCLEKERRKTEIILNKTFLGKRTAAVSNINLPKTPPNATRIDHLIVNQMREQARVASLLERMECLNNILLHINIHTALKRHHMAICIAQTRRKEEITNISKHQRQRANFSEDRDTLLLIMALKDLAATTRKLRTALWCALQMTLPKPVKRQDHSVNREATGTEDCPSPFEGYSFKL